MAEEKDTKATKPEATDAETFPAKKPAAKKPSADKSAKEAKDSAKADSGKTDSGNKSAANSKDAKNPGAAKAAAKKDAEKAEKAEKADAKADAKAEKKPSKKAASSAKKPAPVVDAEPVYVRATARYVRSSPRKARLVVDHIRGSSVEDARVFLQFTARHVGRDVAKVMESAVANAEHNHELDADNLHVVKAFVDEGPTLKRWRPRAKGRATQILKRTSHITVIVSNQSTKEIARNTSKNRKKAAA